MEQINRNIDVCLKKTKPKYYSNHVSDGIIISINQISYVNKFITLHSLLAVIFLDCNQLKIVRKNKHERSKQLAFIYVIRANEMTRETGVKDAKLARSCSQILCNNQNYIGSIITSKISDNNFVYQSAWFYYSNINRPT